MSISHGLLFQRQYSNLCVEMTGLSFDTILSVPRLHINSSGLIYSDSVRKQVCSMKAMVFSVLWELTKSVIRWSHGLVHRVGECPHAWQSHCIQGLSSGIIYFGALWIGEQSRQVNGSPVSREFLETKGSWQYCCILLLLLVCLWLISTPAFAELAETQAPFSKTRKHKRLLKLCFESTGFSSDWVAANYPPCNYGDPRSKQMGKSFVFKWRRNQYVERKGSLFIWTDSRWLDANRQKAEEEGVGTGLVGSWVSLTVYRPAQTSHQHKQGFAYPSLPSVRLAVWVEVEWATSPEALIGLDSDPDAIVAWVLLFCCYSRTTHWCVFFFFKRQKLKKRKSTP